LSPALSLFPRYGEQGKTGWQRPAQVKNVVVLLFLMPQIALYGIRLPGLPDDVQLKLYKEVKGEPAMVVRIDETWVSLGGCHRFLCPKLADAILLPCFWHLLPGGASPLLSMSADMILLAGRPWEWHSSRTGTSSWCRGS
jgi:hypothetical protein